ncbi:MAG: biopolymer transporter ExbD [Bacteroidota bacterium]
MNLRKRSSLRAEVSTSSMNDIMFFLLLFFLIISTLVNPSVIKINLPSSKKSQTMNKQSITVDVSKDLKYFVNNVQVPVDKLESTLDREAKAKQQGTIVLRLDKALSVQDLVDLMQIGYKLKLKMVLSTEPKS